jgi:hypothetical protein
MKIIVGQGCKDNFLNVQTFMENTMIYVLSSYYNVVYISK